MKCYSLVFSTLLLAASYLCLSKCYPAEEKVKQQSFSQVVTRSGEQYIIKMQGLLDGQNTATPLGSSSWQQKFEPNVELSIENNGDTTLVNPNVLINGEGIYLSWKDIEQRVLRDCRSDAEKTRALYEFWTQKRLHATTDSPENNDPFIALNSIGATLCLNDARIMHELFSRAGFKTRSMPVSPLHAATEVYYDDAWHLLDTDIKTFCYKRDNTTVASAVDIAKDTDLSLRSHSYGIFTPEDSITRFFYGGIFRKEESKEKIASPAPPPKRQLWFFRPEEKIVFNWAAPRLIFRRQALQTQDSWKPALNIPTNATLTYHPFNDPGFLNRKGMICHNITFNPSAQTLVAASESAPARLRIDTDLPFLVLDGKIELSVDANTKDDGLSVFLSQNKSNWTQVGFAQAGVSSYSLHSVYDPEKLAAGGSSSWSVRLIWGKEDSGAVTVPPSRAELRALKIETTAQVSRFVLPALHLGKNDVTFLCDDTAEGSDKVSARISHKWKESYENTPPRPPSKPLYPADGQKINSLDVHFTWKNATDPDGDKISDYLFELSDRPDMRWPFSPAFKKLISLTPSKGTAGWKTPRSGLLTPGKTYFWRVKAMDEQGAFSEWSKTWSFTPLGPCPPTALRYEIAGSEIFLSWQPNPEGATPVAYEVYGSNERGFTCYKERPAVSGDLQRGNWYKFERFDAHVSPNYFLTTETCRVKIVSAELEHPAANCCHYRVIAVDTHGARSESSEYLELPNPLIYSRPPDRLPSASATDANPRTAIYQCKSLRSLGKYYAWPTKEAQYHYRYLDERKISWQLIEGPSWLTMNRDAGSLEGTPPPDANGQYRIIIEAAYEGKGHKKSVKQDFVLTGSDAE